MKPNRRLRAATSHRRSDSGSLRGILRLDQQGAITYTKGLTTLEIAQQVNSLDFDSLRRDFDLVVYGDHPATTSMHERSVNGWRSLLGQTVRRR